MSDTCEECGRPLRRGATKTVPMFCFVGFYDDEESETMWLLECRAFTIKQLRAQVSHLEGQFENYDTTDAQNHAVEEVVKKLNRIIDDGKQVGRFGGESLQALVERILRYVK